MESFNEVLLDGKKKHPKGYMVVWREIDKHSIDYRTRTCMARSVDENG